MLQPKNLLTKRGTLLGKEPRGNRKVLVTIGFSDFAFGISVIFSECCPATVSDFETVFLCPLSSSASPAADSYFITQPLLSPPRNANSLSPAVAAATSASACIGSPLLRQG
ncbi:hypothetical protein [Hymenobacter arcticus]